MAKPLLQIALDNLNEKDAYASITQVAEAIDIIEVGTILICAEGKSIVQKLKTTYPNKIILADAKIADAGKILTPMMLDSGADWTTLICCAELATIAGALEVAAERSKDIQIELTGYWDFDQAVAWRGLGVDQVVYHRSRDAQAAGVDWGPADLDKIGRLCELGFKVTVTGGITVDDLKIFAKYPIYIFIAGRSIRDAPNPLAAAEAFQIELARLWK
ncbi:3-keto-L-gulonate 6-phosphate decarboxylase [Erysipelotrichaceae bacterium]|nr:3-keto-L-gulonate 6-phosphate decarboxylase [Erysipelotrichaceae bacterium]